MISIPKLICDCLHSISPSKYIGIFATLSTISNRSNCHAYLLYFFLASNSALPYKRYIPSSFSTVLLLPFMLKPHFQQQQRDIQKSTRISNGRYKSKKKQKRRDKKAAKENEVKGWTKKMKTITRRTNLSV